MNWLEGLSNEERRHHKKALDPDLPHQFRARRITNKNDPKLRMQEWVFTGGRWRRTMTGAPPCRVCGGSKGDCKHL